VNGPPYSHPVQADPRLAKPIAIAADPIGATDPKVCRVAGQQLTKSRSSTLLRPLGWVCFGPLVVPRAALSAQMQDRLIKMPDRRWGLQAGVEAGRGID
jgi:hypothetical protein